MTTQTFQVTDLVGANRQKFELMVSTYTLSVRELIELRVHQEFTALLLYKEAQISASISFKRSLMDSANHQFIWADWVEGFPPGSTWEKEAEIACRNFEEGKFIIIANGRQLENLHDEITTDPIGEIMFIKLLPLMGG